MLGDTLLSTCFELNNKQGIEINGAIFSRFCELQYLYDKMYFELRKENYHMVKEYLQQMKILIGEYR